MPDDVAEKAPKCSTQMTSERKTDNLHVPWGLGQELINWPHSVLNYGRSELRGVRCSGNIPTLPNPPFANAGGQWYLVLLSDVLSTVELTPDRYRRQHSRTCPLLANWR